MSLKLLILFTVFFVNAIKAFTLTVNATKDNEILQVQGGDADTSNFGTAISLRVGMTGNTHFRSLIDFSGISLPQNSVLVSARIQVVRQFTSNQYIPCTTSVMESDDKTGCPSVHLVTKEWGEGMTSQPAVAGESTWIQSMFPTEWSNPGGDFQTEPVGRLLPPPRFLSTWEFELDAVRIRGALASSSSFFGFVLIDANNTGYVEFRSRERSAMNSFGTFSPSLILDFGENPVATIDILQP